VWALHPIRLQLSMSKVLIVLYFSAVQAGNMSSLEVCFGVTSIVSNAAAYSGMQFDGLMIQHHSTNLYSHYILQMQEGYIQSTSPSYPRQQSILSPSQAP